MEGHLYIMSIQAQNYSEIIGFPKATRQSLEMNGKGANFAGRLEKDIPVPKCQEFSYQEAVLKQHLLTWG